MFLLFSFLACGPDTADITTVPLSDCPDGFERRADGLCYELPVDTAEAVDDTSVDTGDSADTSDTDTDTDTEPPVDSDADGTALGADCDDTDASRYPGAPETCNGVDDNCDGHVDEAPIGAPTWYADRDGDGYGDPDDAVVACDAPSGRVGDDDDCDDREATVYPGAPDNALDGLDNDCDGRIDEDFDPCGMAYGWIELPTSSWFFFEDADAVSLDLEGMAWICEVTCSDWWLSATVGEDCAGGEFPWAMTDGGSLCVYASNPGTDATGTCELSTSAGEVTFEGRWVDE